MQCVLLALTVLLAAASALKTSTDNAPRHELPDQVVEYASVNGLLDGGLGAAVEAAMPKHELPVASLRAASWKAKIPDINMNLALAQEWMYIEGEEPANDVNATLLGADAPAGVVVMNAGKPKYSSKFKQKQVKDAPKYYDCGLTMNTAWGAMARDPCSMKVWTVSDKMKDMVPECSKLRYGDKYTESYRALKEDQDQWCGGPVCNPACHKGDKCFRELDFPFSPRCENEVVSAAVKEDSEPAVESKRAEAAQMALAIGVVVVCVLLAFHAVRS